MRLAMLALCLFATAASAQPRAPSGPPTDRWHMKAREIFARTIAFQTVQGRNQSPEMADYLAAEFRAQGFGDVIVHRYDDTASLILRWPAARPSGRKAILIMAHMDVVEARRADWSREPFVLGEEGGYFHGRGTLDNKSGVVAVTAALMRLKAEGFQSDRDIIVLFTGDEETSHRGAERAANEWLDPATIDFGLNADSGSGGYDMQGQSLGFNLQTAEKIYTIFTFTATRPGGHSASPRPDNGIYALGRALARLDAHRFPPRLSATTRLMFTDRLRTADPALAAAIRRWLADENDGEAADLVEATQSEAGLTRTRCVATRIEGGHADNALPLTVRATVNCRLFPSDDPAELAATLNRIAAPDQITVEQVGIARPSDASPLRDDVVEAYTAAVRARHPGAAIIPEMTAGASDGLYFRNRGVPVYGVSGIWVRVPDEARAHSRDEVLPVAAFYANVDHWTDMIRRLAASPSRRRAPR